MFYKITSSTKKVFSKKPVYKSKHYSLYSAPNDHDTARLAVLITKKAVNLAVIRNRVRRQIKEDFRMKCFLLPKHDFLVIISSKINSAKHEISDILMQEWKKSTESLSKSL